MVLSPRLAEAADPRALALRRYQKAVDRLTAQQDRLTDVQVRNTLSVLAASRRRISDELAALAGQSTASTFQASQLGTLRDAIDRQAVRLVSEYRPILGSAIAQSWQRGVALTPDALGAARVDIGALPDVSLAQLNVALTLTSEAAIDVGTQFRQRMRQMVTLAVIGETPVHVLQQQIHDLLRSEPNLVGRPRGLIAKLTEDYARNGMMTVFNVANQQRHNQIANDVPGLRKYWRSARDPRVRPDHQRANARYAPGGSEGPIPVDALYEVGDEEARFPHDPMLSGKQRNRCRCVSVLHHTNWFE